MKPRYHLIQKIIILLLALLIPASCISFLSQYQANKKLERQILMSIHDRNISYMDRLDDNLQQLYHMDYHLMNNYEWIHFKERTASMNDFEKFQYINAICDQLTLIKTISPLLESVNIYFPDTATIYHSSPYQYGSYSTLNIQQAQQFENLFTTGNYLQFYSDPVSGKKMLSLFMEPESSAIDYYIILSLSIDSLQKSIEDNCSYIDDYYYYITDNDFSLSNMDSSMKKRVKKLAGQISAGVYKGFTKSPYTQLTIDNQDYYMFCYRLTYSGGFYVRLISSSSLLNVIPSGHMMIFLFCCVIFIACIIFFLGIYRMVHKPLTHLVQAFTQVEQGDFTVCTDQIKDSDFAYVFQGFNHMVNQLNTLIEQNYTQAVLLQKAELKQLQAQINPHFLYNSFFMLQSMIRWDPEQAENIANALARYFQYITRNSNELVPLSAEYSHAKDYIYIQKLRFSGRIQLEAEEMPDDYATLQVPKLILQPVLENVFNHGLKNKMDHGLLQISFHTDNNMLKILIEDNGENLDDHKLGILSDRLNDSKKPEFAGEITGIMNIQKRLMIFSHYDSPLCIFRSKLGGLAVEISLFVDKHA